MNTHTGTGTVRIWKDDPDYMLRSVEELDRLPLTGTGVFVLISETPALGKVIIFLGKLNGRRSPIEEIKRLLVRKELDFYQTNCVAFRSRENAEAAQAERDRLEDIYRPMVESIFAE